jgi:hypothetical protein
MRTYTIYQAARACMLTEAALRGYVAKDQVKFHREGRSVLFTEEELETIRDKVSHRYDRYK